MAATKIVTKLTLWDGREFFSDDPAAVQRFVENLLATEKPPKGARVKSELIQMSGKQYAAIKQSPAARRLFGLTHG